MKLKTTVFSILVMVLAIGCGGDEDKASTPVTKPVSDAESAEMNDVLMTVVDSAGENATELANVMASVRAGTLKATESETVSFTSPDGTISITGTSTYDDASEYLKYDCAITFNNYQESISDPEYGNVDLTLNGTVNWVWVMNGNLWTWSYDGDFDVVYNGVSYDYAWNFDYSWNLADSTYAATGSYTINGYTWNVNDSGSVELTALAPSKKALLKR